MTLPIIAERLRGGKRDARITYARRPGQSPWPFGIALALPDMHRMHFRA